MYSLAGLPAYEEAQRSLMAEQGFLLSSKALDDMDEVEKMIFMTQEDLMQASPGPKRPPPLPFPPSPPLPPRLATTGRGRGERKGFFGGGGGVLPVRAFAECWGRCASFAAGTQTTRGFDSDSCVEPNHPRRLLPLVSEANMVARDLRKARPLPLPSKAEAPLGAVHRARFNVRRRRTPVPPTGALVRPRGLEGRLEAAPGADWACS